MLLVVAPALEVLDEALGAYDGSLVLLVGGNEHARRMEASGNFRLVDLIDGMSIWGRAEEQVVAQLPAVSDALSTLELDTRKLLKTSILPSARETRLYGGKRDAIL